MSTPNRIETKQNNIDDFRWQGELAAISQLICTNNNDRKQDAFIEDLQNFTDN